MKLLLELDSFGNSTPWLLHTKLPRTIAVLSDCGHCYKMGQTASPSVLPDPSVKAPCFLCSGPGWDLAWDVSWVAVTLVRATSSEVLLGLKGPLPKWLIHRAGGWCWLSTRMSQFSSLWSLQQHSLDFFIWWLVSKRERERRVRVLIEAVVFCNLTLEVTSHHFC